MAIIFKTIRWKNFLSTGNDFTEIPLNKNSTTLIVGENGAGKSTILDAICFALYGKAFRNINKPQLLSSINQKDCLVEIEFSIGNKQYKIERGIKPAVFNIIVDGKLLDQDAASKDYQDFLETQILKINYRSFTQIVILGTASFTPFMQLPAAQRREIIEDILDIKIFSSMNVLLKEKMSLLKDSIKELDTRIEVQKEKTLLQRSFIKTLEERQQKQKNNIEEQIKEEEAKIEEKNEQLKKIKADVDSLRKAVGYHENVKQKIKEIESSIGKFTYQMERLEKEKLFYEKNDVCPTCEQKINNEAKAAHFSRHEQEKLRIGELVERARTEQKVLEEQDKKYKANLLQLESLTNSLSAINAAISSSIGVINRLKKELEPTDDHDLDEERKKLKAMAQDVVKYSNAKIEKNEEKQYMEICGILLKDTGIKTTVIKQYIPVINKLINKYLTIMDFFVHFELDEAFNESIKSRYRDDFSYSSFSEGEKQRINLALLFTWRQIAKMKNSVNTNLLLLDEVFDSSLDSNGTEFVLQLIDSLTDDTNVFVISHKSDQLIDKFQTTIKFEKKNNYSRITHEKSQSI